MALALAVVAVLGVLSAVSFDSVPGWMHMARFSLVMLIAFCVTAYFLNFAGLYLYGVLIALAPLAGEVLWVHFRALHHGYPITFGLVTGFLFLVGVVKLIKLLRSHPLPDEGASLEAANG
jgi:hypothetical protein